MGDLISLNANNIIALSALIGFLWGVLWANNKNITGVLAHAVYGVTALFLAVLIRVGWWVVAAVTKPDNCNGITMLERCAHNSWMFDNRHIPNTIASLLFVVGVFTFIRGLEGFPLEEKIGWVLTVIYTSTGITVMTL